MKRQPRPTIGAVEFIDRVIKCDEKGQAFTLAPYQRRVLEMWGIRGAQNISICKRKAIIIARPKLIIPRVNFTALTA